MATGRNGLDRTVDFLKRDVFAIIWVIFIVVIILLTFFGKEYIKDMIVVTILFLAIFMLQPLIRLSAGSKITKKISGGKEVPLWKRFPLFFVAILIVFTIKNVIEVGLDQAFPEHSINIVLVAFWLIALFAIYYLILLPRIEEPKDGLIKTSRVHRNYR
jgi:hypothetical protein